MILFSLNNRTNCCMHGERRSLKLKLGFAKIVPYRGKFQHSLRLFRSFPGFNFSCKPSGAAGIGSLLSAWDLRQRSLRLLHLAHKIYKKYLQTMKNSTSFFTISILYLISDVIYLIFPVSFLYLLKNLLYLNVS